MEEGRCGGWLMLRLRLFEKDVTKWVGETGDENGGQSGEGKSVGGEQQDAC